MTCTPIDQTSRLQRDKFRFFITDYEELSYGLKSLTTPAIFGNSLDLNTKQAITRNTYDTIEYQTLEAVYRLDSSFNNYSTLYNFMLDCKSENQGKNAWKDAYLLIEDAFNKPKTRVKFVNLFPIYIGSLDFSYSVDSVEYLELDVSFTFDYLEIESI